MWLVSKLRRLGDSPARTSRSRICATANERVVTGEFGGEEVQLSSGAGFTSIATRGRRLGPNRRALGPRRRPHAVAMMFRAGPKKAEILGKIALCDCCRRR